MSPPQHTRRKGTSRSGLRRRSMPQTESMTRHKETEGRIDASNVSLAQRPAAVSWRNRVTALEIFFIMTDSDPSRSTPCKDASDGAEIMSPRQTSVEGFPSTVTGHI